MNQSDPRGIERDRRLEEIFEKAFPLSGAEREELLCAACGEDVDLRRHIDELLECDAAPDSSLFAPDALLALPPDDSPTTHASGLRLGSYRIVEPIGEGGMGTVYLAEQERPRRHVALKVLRSGLVSPSALRRFEHEAQILGTLDHPGIARIVEAGTAEVEGRETPFFVMEHVRGVTLLAYAANAHLDPCRRIELFLRICDAVIHAHQKGVIHRDLKPANILVDAAGNAKVLDFGVARAIDGEARAATLHTLAGQIIGTLPYMSPEQATGDPDGVDTRSDIYSLGVILFELLAGRLPQDLEGKPITEALATIRDQDSVSLAATNREFRGDLSTIVGKALAKDRAERYQTVGELALDLRRYLRHEPISARPPSSFYLLQKYAKRHRAGLAALLVAASALVVGGLAAVWKGFQAQEEGAKAKAISEFLLRMLSAPSPDFAGQDVKVVDILDPAAAQLAEEFGQRPELRLPLLSAIAQSYNHLGLPAKARPLLEEVLSAYTKRYGEDHEKTIEVLNSLVDACAGMHDYKQALELGREAVARSEAALGSSSLPTLVAKKNLGRILVFTVDFRHGIELLNEAVSGFRHHLDPLDRVRIATELDAAPYVGSLEERERLARSLIERLERARPDDHPLLLRARLELSTCSRLAGRPDEAERILREVHAVYGRHPEVVHTDSISVVAALTALLLDNERAAEADSFAEEYAAMVRSAYGEDSLQFAQARAERGRCWIALGRHTEAEAELLAALAALSKPLGDRHPLSQRVCALLAHLYVAWGRPEEAASYRARLTTATTGAGSFPAVPDKP